MQPQAAADNEAPSRVAIWGLPLAALVLAIAALMLVWCESDRLGIPDGTVRTWVLVSIPALLVTVLIAHLIAISTGAYAGAARWFRHASGGKRILTASQSLNRDPRLHRFYEELRIAHGWRWRRLPWLLVNGTGEHVEQVAPGLKQAGVLYGGEVVLVHASPDGIEARKWLAQIRQLRGRCAVDGVAQVVHADEPDRELPRTLSLIATGLGWAAPVSFVHPVTAHGTRPERFDAVGTFLPNGSRRQARAGAAGLPQRLSALEGRTADIGMHVLCQHNTITWQLEISKYAGDHGERIAEGLRALAASNWLRAPLAGVFFAPVFAGAAVAPVPIPLIDENNGNGMPGEPTGASPAQTATREQPAALLPVWREIAAGSLAYRGRRAGYDRSDALAKGVFVCALAWSVALIVSDLGNWALVDQAEALAATALAAPPGTPQALRAQLALQQQIDTLEYRREHGVPWHLRAGLSRNEDLLDALWQPYGIVAARNLRQPVVRALEAQLAERSQVRADAPQSHNAQQLAYRRLKAYLMLTTPARTEAPFLTTQLLELWPAPAGMRAGEWLDTSQRLARFWSEHLKAHPDWRVGASMPLVTRMRSTLINQIGLAASDEALYQRP